MRPEASDAWPEVEEVVELTQSLVRINTVNPPGNEKKAVEHLGRYLRSKGLAVEYQELARDRANLICRLGGGSDSGHLILSGHIDVVHQGQGAWEVDPFGAERRDGQLVGRGTADMKGGLAAMAVAVAFLAEQNFVPRSDLILAVSAGEEVDTAGARLMAASGVLDGSSMIVVGEPTALDVYVAEKGVLWLRLTAHGQTAHGSMPHLGVNAISFITHVISKLEAYPFSFAPSAILGSPTLSVNVITGGVKANVVADRCTIEIDMRLVPGQERDAVLTELATVLQNVTSETGLKVETGIEVLQNMPAVETATTDPLVTTVVGVAESVRGTRPAVGGVSYGTDGAVLAPSLGASLLIFGPGSPGQAHQPNEYVDVEELGQAAKAYVLLARRLLS